MAAGQVDEPQMPLNPEPLEGADTPEEEDPETALGYESAEVILAAKDHLEACGIAYGENRGEELDDLNFLAGNQWDPEVRRLRELDGRPCLTINKLPTFLHQVTNDQRQNVPGIKVSAVSMNANPEGAENRQGMVRHIEYASNADVAYDTAVNSAAAIGEGYFEIITDYCKPDSFDQDIRFKRIANSFTVYPDPLSDEPDGSDQKRAAISLKMTRKAFEADYPHSEATSQQFDLAIGDPSNKDWIGKDFVRVAKFYRIEEKPAVLVELTNGEVGYQDDLLSMPAGVTIKRKRKSYKPRTMLYKLTAVEVLEATEIKCPFIPVFPVYGDELNIDGKIVRAGLIRNAKDPSRMYNFWMTSATEEVALRPRVPFIGAEGQFEGYEDDWAQANVRSFPYMEYRPVALEGMLAPAPQRQQMADIPVGALQMAMHANDNIKATTGLFDSSLGARGNATSGIQERAQQRQGDVANFHFSDNLQRTVRHAGRCILAMIPYYYDAHRVVQIMGEDEKVSSIEINKPAPVDINGAPQMPAGSEPSIDSSVSTTLNDMTKGDYAATVRAGPSYDTLRQEAAASMAEWGKNWPKLMDIAGDKVMRVQDWPGADEIADRVAKTIPPELRDDGEEQAEPMVQTPKGPIPLEQAGQMLAEMDQQIQVMGQQLQEASSGLEKAKIDAASREKVAEINAVSKSDVAELTGLVQLLIAKTAPPPALAAEVASDVAKDGGSDAVMSSGAPPSPPQTPLAPGAQP